MKLRKYKPVRNLLFNGWKTRNEIIQQVRLFIDKSVLRKTPVKKLSDNVFLDGFGRLHPQFWTEKHLVNECLHLRGGKKDTHDDLVDLYEKVMFDRTSSK